MEDNVNGLKAEEKQLRNDMDNLRTFQKAMHTIEISFAVTLHWWRRFDERKKDFVTSFDNHTLEARKVYDDKNIEQLKQFVQGDIYTTFRGTIEKMKRVLTKIAGEYESIRERMKKTPVTCH